MHSFLLQETRKPTEEILLYPVLKF